jgi:hypothetical protein
VNLTNHPQGMHRSSLTARYIRGYGTESEPDMCSINMTISFTRSLSHTVSAMMPRRPSTTPFQECFHIHVGSIVLLHPVSRSIPGRPCLLASCCNRREVSLVLISEAANRFIRMNGAPTYLPKRRWWTSIAEGRRSGSECVHSVMRSAMAPQHCSPNSMTVSWKKYLSGT